MVPVYGSRNGLSYVGSRARFPDRSGTSSELGFMSAGRRKLAGAILRCPAGAQHGLADPAAIDRVDPVKVCILGKSDTPVSRLAQYLVENTHDVHLVSGLLEEEPPAGVRLHRIEMKGLSLFGAARKVRHIVSQVQPDVVHAFYLTSYGYLASALKDVPVLATAMGTDVFGAPELNRLLSPLRRRMALRAVGRADKIHSVAEHMTERLVQ